MNKNVKVIFEDIKNALGESSSVITDRTIEQTINEFSAFAPQENAEKFWNESVVNHLKNTVAGQVRAFASDKRSTATTTDTDTSTATTTDTDTSTRTETV